MRKLPILAIISLLAFLGVGCLGGGPQVAIMPIELEYWRAEDPPEALDMAVEAYRKLHPNVTINVRSFRADEYERELLEALAEDRGPDMFSIPNVWMRSWQAKLLPLPEKTVIPSQVVNDNKQIVTINLESRTLTKLDMINSYVEAAVADTVLWTVPQFRGDQPVEKIWGLPYSLDTMALFYNVDLLRQADIEKPPENWKEFQTMVKQLTVYDDEERIEQSGAAIGKAGNVRYHTELLSSIMMQNGTVMAREDGWPTFNRVPAGGEYGRGDSPGIEALSFYQSFGRPQSTSYTWDSYLPDSLDAFIAGKTAFYFGFPNDRQIIKEQAPRLNFQVTGMPLVEANRPAYVAKFPVEVVSAKTAHPNESWDFIQFAARDEQVVDYLIETGRPTALRSLIEQQLTDPDAAPFVSQVLTAESWYRGKNYDRVEAAFAKMIETYPIGRELSYMQIINAATEEVNASMR